MHSSQWITLPTQSCLVLYSFCANLLHSLNMWLIVLSLSPHNLHLLICCVLSILTLIWLVLMAIFCTAIGRFPFFGHVHFFLCEMSLVSHWNRPKICFFSPLLFSVYFRSVDPRVISIVSSDCNQSSSALFYVVFESLYRCVNAASMLASPFPPSFLDTYSLLTSSLGCKALCMVIKFLVF